jgi:hypothetical protein
MGTKYVSYQAVQKCFEQVASASESIQYLDPDGCRMTIHYPLIGAGLGGGDLAIISDIIEAVFAKPEHKDKPRTLWIYEQDFINSFIDSAQINSKMYLLKLLQEASSLKISDLKKAIKKDKRAAIIFDKDLSLENIRDKDGFLATLKYYFFNNQEVRDFIAARHSIKEINKLEFDDLKKKQGKDLTQADLYQIQDMVNIVFKEYSAVDRGSMSAELKRELSKWINTSGRYFNLPKWALAELKSLPGVRPNKRVLLYRGLLFNNSDLGSREKYDGTLEIGDGLKFLKTIREGGREVDLKWDRPSSWTTDKSIAIQFAKYGPASSHVSAMMGWFDSQIEKHEIDGALGYVISTFANPEDILLDTQLVTLNGKHGNEGEMLLQPGEYLTRVVHKFTVNGEVDPSMSTAADEDLPVSKAIKATEELSQTFKVSDLIDVSAKELKQNIWGSSSVKILNNTSLFKKLILNSATTATLHAYDKLLDFYKHNLDYLQDDDLLNDKYAHSDELREKVQSLKKVVTRFRNTINHSKFKSDKNPNAKGKMHELSSEEYRATIKCYDLADLEKQLLLQGRIVDREGQVAFGNLASALGIDLPVPAGFAMFGSAKQKPVIDEVVNAFYNKIGVAKPGDLNEAIKMMLNLIRKAYRNYEMIQMLEQLQSDIQDIK